MGSYEQLALAKRKMARKYEDSMVEDRDTWEMIHRGLYTRQYPCYVSVLKLDASEPRLAYVLMIRSKAGIAYTTLINYYIGEGEDLKSADLKRWSCPDMVPSKALLDSASKVLMLLGYAE